jgi:ubiquinone/menaquinone biosynthesis C-methylase UbiE/broad specificity phosphatase PhoE
MRENSSVESAIAEQGPALRLLLICHAEAMDVRPTQDTPIDTGLTAHGWQQTDALAAWLAARFTIDALVSAPELRNRLTAQRIGQAIGLPVTIHRDWPGEPYGANVGADDATLAVPQAIQRIPWARTLDSPESNAPEDGLARYCDELTGILTQLSETHPGETVAIVMGSSLISATIACLVGAQHFHAATEPTSIAELRLQNDAWTVHSLNRHEHLPTPPGKMESTSPQPIPLSEGGDSDMAVLVDLYNRAAAQASSQPEDGKRAKRIQDLLNFAKLPADLAILDVGAGRGDLSIALARNNAMEVIGIDVSPAMLEQAELRRLGDDAAVAQRVYFRLAAARTLPFRDERFDAVVCRLLLHHIRNADKVLTELVRVLRSGGTFILADLLSNDDPVKRATQNAIEERRNPTHYAARSAQQYRDLLTAAGLTVVDEKVVTFERELDEWLGEMPLDTANGAVVRDMMEAGLETDAAGLNVRRHGETISFDQRLFYCRALKE